MDTDNKSKEYLVTGNLDKPLGISDPRPANYKSKLVYLSLFGVVVLAGLSGFAFNKYLSSPPETIEIAKQPDRKDPTASDNTITAYNKNTLKKRPDLAIDENAPALQELQPWKIFQVSFREDVRQISNAKQCLRIYLTQNSMKKLQPKTPCSVSRWPAPVGCLRPPS